MNGKLEQGITVKKNENFSEWYNQVILKSGMADYSPVKGCMIFKPLSYSIWENIQKILNSKFKELGVENTYFPLFIPESLLKKEEEHFEGFTPEVAWITKGGDRDLDEKLAVRPTSETIIYSYLSKWIRSHRDLPLLLNQWCNVVRWETKATRLFLRTREFLWQEGHTCHRTEEDAEEFMLKILNLYKDFVENYLAIPVLDGYKSEGEKFAGALRTTTIEALMPDKKALQMGTSHNLGQNFSKVFNIKFFDKDEREKYVWQTSWGVSTRMIGALIMIHGDDKGLILPPKISPFQIVIIPISVEKNPDVLNYARKIDKELKSRFSVILDDRKEYTPGWKFNDWELKGIPLRVEIGPKEMKNNTLTLTRRDNGKRIEIKRDEIEKISSILDDIQNNLFNKAKEFLKENIHNVENIEEFRNKIGEGFVKANHCLNVECEERIKDEFSATIRVIPFKDEKINGKCIYCNRNAKKKVYFAKSY